MIGSADPVAPGTRLMLNKRMCLIGLFSLEMSISILDDKTNIGIVFYAEVKDFYFVKVKF